MLTLISDLIRRNELILFKCRKSNIYRSPCGYIEAQKSVGLLRWNHFLIITRHDLIEAWKFDGS